VLAITEIRVLRSSELAFGDQRISRSAISESRAGRPDLPPLVMLSTTSSGELDDRDRLVTARAEAADTESAHEDVALLAAL
jgi:hypothetical protein